VAILAILASLGFFLFACRVASQVPLRHEFFTSHIAQLDYRGMWAVLSAKWDYNPPTYYQLVSISTVFLGVSPFSIRLPSIVGFWAMAVCLGLFVGRRCQITYAWVAGLLPLATDAFPYAWEARPYGLALGFTALALFCWQVAADGSASPLALVGVALGLGGATASHYYAVLGHLGFETHSA
jgi:hypothetical protein